MVRRGLSTLLAEEPWIDEVVEAASADEAVREAVSQRVDIIAMDVTLHDGDGIEATSRITRVRPEAKVLILTMSEDEEIVANALRAGARGYVLKDTDPDTIVDALKMVAEGQVVLCPKVSTSVAENLRHTQAELPPPFDQLTPREREILSLLARGNSNAKIARQLGLSEKTIRNQLSAVFMKIGVSDRVQAALRAREVGLG